jgi:hypothetical protein
MNGGLEGAPGEFLSLSEAARRAGRSLRTIQLWIEEGLVGTVPHPTDRRRRLVATASLDRAVERLAERDTVPIAAMMAYDVDHAAVLAAVQGLSWRAGQSAEGAGIRLTGRPDEDLLKSPFADWLWILISTVRGTLDEHPAVIQQALTDVLMTLYSDPITRHIVVPDEFWSATLIGRHVGRARLLLHPTTGLVSLNEIVATVGIPRGRVENILQAIRAERLYDPDESRWLYPRDAIAAVQSWESDPNSASTESAATDEEPQASQARTDPAPLEFSPTENRRELRAVRDAYHRRHFRSARQ